MICGTQYISRSRQSFAATTAPLKGACGAPPHPEFQNSPAHCCKIQPPLADAAASIQLYAPSTQARQRRQTVRTPSQCKNHEWPASAAPMTVQFSITCRTMHCAHRKLRPSHRLSASSTLASGSSNRSTLCCTVCEQDCHLSWAKYVRSERYANHNIELELLRHAHRPIIFSIP